eukprot:Awhi_evm1s1551
MKFSILTSSLTICTLATSVESKKEKARVSFQHYYCDERRQHKCKKTESGTDEDESDNNENGYEFGETMGKKYAYQADLPLNKTFGADRIKHNFSIEDFPYSLKNGTRRLAILASLNYNKLIKKNYRGKKIKLKGKKIKSHKTDDSDDDSDSRVILGFNNFLTLNLI